MKVLYSNPPWWEAIKTPFQWRAGVRAGSRWPFSYQSRSTPDRYQGGEYIPVPFFMSYSATYLAKALGYTGDINDDASPVTVRDSIALRESYDSWLRFLKNTLPEYIVIESATPSWENDKNCIERIRATVPHAKVIVTGPITTTKHEEALAIPNVVAAIRGEYEKGVVRVVNGETGLIDFDLMTEAELNAAPFPWMNSQYVHRYYDPCPQGQQFPHAQVWSSRGCWAKCVFCIWPAAMTGNDPDGTKKRTVRHYHAEYMTAFLTEWRDRYRFRSIYFDDDLFNTSDRHVLEMCKVMEQVKLPWSCMCRADTIKRETWAAMKQAGCFGVKVGMESGSQEVLDNIINKRLNLQEAVETLEWLKQLGVRVHTTWAIGAPGETHSQAEQTLQMIDDLYRRGLHSTHQLSGMAAIEGSPLGTLLQVGKLERYPGATTAGFDAEPDGHKKAEAFSR